MQNVDYVLKNNERFFTVNVQTTIGGTYRVALFNALSPQVYSHYQGKGFFNQPSFISAQRPQLSTEGITASIASGNINGNISWITAPGTTAAMLGLSNDGLSFFLISSNDTNGYMALLEFIKTQPVKVNRIKLSTNDLNQFKNDLTIVKRKEDGSVQSETIILSNMVTPQQVNNYVLDFKTDFVIDKYTTIETDIVANQLGYSMIFYYDYVK